MLPAPRIHGRLLRLSFVALALFAVAGGAPPAIASPTLGFTESWSDGTIRDWMGQAPTSNPGSGGADGGGYLLISRPTAPGRLGAHSTGPEYTGNWRAANIERVTLWLNDVGTDEALEIHFSLGRFDNLWQYNVGFLPPENAWAVFSVDLRSAANFTQIIGFSTFEAALQSAEVVHVRHDLAPYMQTPDQIQGDFGLDELTLTNFVTDVAGAPRAALRPVMLEPPYPNPASGSVALRFESFDAGEVRVEIVDARGRLVRREVLPAAAPGRKTWAWDGRDDRGGLVAAGVYRARARNASGGTSRPFVFVR